MHCLTAGASMYVRKCPRGDLNTPTREISPDRGIHMVRLAGLYTSMSSRLSGLRKCRPSFPFGRFPLWPEPRAGHCHGVACHRASMGRARSGRRRGGSAGRCRARTRRPGDPAARWRRPARSSVRTVAPATPGPRSAAVTEYGQGTGYECARPRRTARLAPPARLPVMPNRTGRSTRQPSTCSA
jgi:hypothetical protein